jgi:hypothetical protein
MMKRQYLSLCFLFCASVFCFFLQMSVQSANAETRILGSESEILLSPLNDDIPGGGDVISDDVQSGDNEPDGEPPSELDIINEAAGCNSGWRGAALFSMFFFWSIGMVKFCTRLGHEYSRDGDTD